MFSRPNRVRATIENVAAIVGAVLAFAFVLQVTILSRIVVW